MSRLIIKVEQNLLNFVFVILFLSSNIILGQSGFDTNNLNSTLESEATKNEINISDVKDYYISDNYTSKGFSHLYLNQSHNGIPILETNIGIHQYNDYIYSNFNIIPNLSSYTFDNQIEEAPEEVIKSLANLKGYNYNNDFALVKFDEIENEFSYSNASLSLSDIHTKIWYYQKNKKEMTICYQITIEQVSDAFVKSYYFDPISNKIIKEIDLTLTCEFGPSTDGEDHTGHHHHDHSKINHNIEFVADSSYNIFPWPLSSPHDGARSEVIKPWLANTTASPFGWHTIGATNYQHTRGNNVDAYDDNNNSNSATGGNDARADGGANLNFDFPWTTATPLSQYKDASVTNLFYWNNIIHDVWFNYGFDEPSGNFQEENYTTLGQDSDYVRAESQDGGGTCNANFSTQSDGNNPRMQMYNCSNNGNSRDGSFDNLVIVHEYGHGISIRLTGGPGASGCLNGSEQMGEGWSDYFGAVMTIKPSDVGTDLRPVGNWLFGQGPNGGGIRSYPYTTDMTANPFTYDDIKTQSVPHGVGSVWATMIWDMTWSLIDLYGFDPDIYNGTGGNNIAMRLVIEGLKLQPCSPGFVDGRDAILAADQALYGGANQCLIWEAFANRGLGFSANQGSSSLRGDGVEAFDMPPSCSYTLELSSNKSEVAIGGNITYDFKIVNTRPTDIVGLDIYSKMPDTTSFVNASNGASLSGDTVVWPSATILTGDSIEYSYTVNVDPSKSSGFYDIDDNVENGNTLWEVINAGSTSFAIQNGTSNSGTQAWFANDGSSPGISIIQNEIPIGVKSNSQLEFTHLYDTEINWDGGRVFISEDLGSTWVDAGSLFTQNGYNNIIYNSIPGFSGNSGGFTTSIIDLSSYVGKIIIIRFQMDCDQTIGGNGWYIDDIKFNNVHHMVYTNLEIDDNGTKDLTLFEPITYINGDTTVSFGLEATEVSCGFTNDGSIDLDITNPNNYTYLWSNGAMTQNISNLTGGVYSVTVTSSSGYSGIDSIIVLSGTNSYITKSVDDNSAGTLRNLAGIGLCPNDTLIIHPSLAGDTILLSSEIGLRDNMVILGLGKNNSTIKMTGSTEVFSVRNFILTLQDLTITGVNSPNGPIVNDGTVILQDVKLQGNTDGSTTLLSLKNTGQLIIKGDTELK